MLIFKRPPGSRPYPSLQHHQPTPLCSLCSSITELLTASQICQMASGFHVSVHITHSAFPFPSTIRQHSIPHSKLSFYKVIPDPSLGRTGDSFLSVPSRSSLNSAIGPVTLNWIYLVTQIPPLLDYQSFDTRYFISLISVFTDYVKLYTWHLVSI